MRYFSFMLMYFIFSCAAQNELSHDSTSSVKITNGQYDESFDPLSLDDDDIVVKREISEADVRVTPDAEKIKVTDKNQIQEVEGYRVQLIATRSIETATVAQQRAVDQFSNLNYKVYLIFEAPLYRIRIGDAVTRRQAEGIRELAKERGYDEAFIVRSKVLVSETTQFNEGY